MLDWFVNCTSGETHILPQHTQTRTGVSWRSEKRQTAVTNLKQNTKVTFTQITAYKYKYTNIQCKLGCQ